MDLSISFFFWKGDEEVLEAKKSKGDMDQRRKCKLTSLNFWLETWLKSAFYLKWDFMLVILHV